jgi:hypothetical protein
VICHQCLVIGSRRCQATYSAVLGLGLIALASCGQAQSIATAKADGSQLAKVPFVAAPTTERLGGKRPGACGGDGSSTTQIAKGVTTTGRPWTVETWTLNEAPGFQILIDGQVEGGLCNTKESSASRKADRLLDSLVVALPDLLLVVVEAPPGFQVTDNDDFSALYEPDTGGGTVIVADMTASHAISGGTGSQRIRAIASIAGLLDPDTNTITATVVSEKEFAKAVRLEG